MISPPEKKVPMMLPRVIGKSMRERCLSSQWIVTRAGRRRCRWLRAIACSDVAGSSSSAPLMRSATRSPARKRRAVGTIADLDLHDAKIYAQLKHLPPVPGFNEPGLEGSRFCLPTLLGVVNILVHDLARFDSPPGELPHFKGAKAARTSAGGPTSGSKPILRRWIKRS